MNDAHHYRKLVHMFDVAPINQQLIKGAVLQVSQERAQLLLSKRISFSQKAIRFILKDLFQGEN